MPIEDIPGRPARRYCSPAHRAAARRSRRAVTAVEQAARLAEVLPWVGGGNPTPERAPAPAATVVLAPVDVVASDALGGSTRLAVIEPPLPDQPPPAEAGRGSIELPLGSPVGGAGRESIELPPDPPVGGAGRGAIEPPPTSVGAGCENVGRPVTVRRAVPPERRSWPGGDALAALSGSSARLRGRPPTSVVGSADRDEPAGRLRGLAVLSAAAVLIGSYTVTTSDTVAPPVVVPTQVTPVGETHAQWAVRAQGVLASVTEQLEIIADTEVTWNRAGEAQRSAARSAPFEALMQRKQLLLQRQASLQSQLAAYESLVEAKRQLALAEQQLVVIEATLSGAPPVGERTPEQTYAIAMLLAQRDLNLAQRDARRQEVLRLEQAMTDAVRTPLPADDRHTAVVSGLVLDSLAGADQPGPEEAHRARRPDVIDNRAGNVLTRVRYDIPNGAPPDPRGPRAEPQHGPGGAVTDTVRDVVPVPVLPDRSTPERSSPSFGGGMGDAIAGPLIENVPGAKERFGGGGVPGSDSGGVEPGESPRIDDSSGLPRPRQDDDADVDTPTPPNVSNLPGEWDQQMRVAAAPPHGVDSDSNNLSRGAGVEESDRGSDDQETDGNVGAPASDEGIAGSAYTGYQDSGSAGGGSDAGDSDGSGFGGGDPDGGDSGGGDSDGDSDDGDSGSGDSDGGDSGGGDSGSGDSDGGESDGGDSDGGDSDGGDSDGGDSDGGDSDGGDSDGGDSDGGDAGGGD